MTLTQVETHALIAGLNERAAGVHPTGEGSRPAVNLVVVEADGPSMQVRLAPGAARQLAQALEAAAAWQSEREANYLALLDHGDGEEG